jgi:hypothetical protein
VHSLLLPIPTCWLCSGKRISWTIWFTITVPTLHSNDYVKNGFTFSSSIQCWCICANVQTEQPDTNAKWHLSEQHV